MPATDSPADREALDGTDAAAGSAPTVREMLLGVLHHIAYHVGRIRLPVRRIVREEASS